jgi:hypothetical protein
MLDNAQKNIVRNNVLAIILAEVKKNKNFAIKCRIESFFGERPIVADRDYRSRLGPHRFYVKVVAALITVNNMYSI